MNSWSGRVVDRSWMKLRGSDGSGNYLDPTRDIVRSLGRVSSRGKINTSVGRSRRRVESDGPRAACPESTAMVRLPAPSRARWFGLPIPCLVHIDECETERLLGPSVISSNMQHSN